MTRFAECTGATLAGIAIGLGLRHINHAVVAVEHAVEAHHAARAAAIAAASKERKDRRYAKGGYVAGPQWLVTFDDFSKPSPTTRGNH